MDDRIDATNPDANRRVDRRSVIKKGLAIGSLGYVAPMIVGSSTSVSAQAVSGSTCSTTDTCETFSCGGGDCACVPITEGGTACITPCCTFVECTTSADCASGQVCFTLDCCGDTPNGRPGFCIPLCGSTDGCAVGAPPAFPTSAGGTKSGRWLH